MFIKFLFHILLPDDHKFLTLRILFVNYHTFVVMKNREKVIQKINELAWANYPELEIYLYGSQARGEAKHISDWDLLVLLKVRRISFKLETKLMDEFYDLELETGEIFSPLIYSESDWTRNHVHSPLYEIIQKDGIRIK